jgi:hypothetical protein
VFSDAAITNSRYILELAFKRTTKIAIGKKRIKVYSKVLARFIEESGSVASLRPGRNG